MHHFGRRENLYYSCCQITIGRNMTKREKVIGTKIGKKVAIECYTTINPGEIRFGRSVEEKHFKKKR